MTVVNPTMELRHQSEGDGHEREGKRLIIPPFNATSAADLDAFRVDGTCFGEKDAGSTAWGPNLWASLMPKIQDK